MISDLPSTLEVDQHDEPAGDLAGAPEHRPRSRAARLLSARSVIPVVVLVLAVVLAVLLVVNHRTSAEQDARAEAPGVVAEHVTKLLSYTPATVSSDLATERKWLTGDFLDDYTTLVTRTIAPAATQGAVTADATVVARAVQSASADRVELLMFVNVTTTRTGDATPRSEGSRIRVVAVKVGGSWLISSLSPV